jgi:hypothetical protein
MRVKAYESEYSRGLEVSGASGDFQDQAVSCAPQNVNRTRYELSGVLIREALVPRRQVQRLNAAAESREGWENYDETF